MLRDRNIAWDYGKIWIPAKEFLSVSNIALDGNAANAYVTQGSAATDGAPVFGDLGTTATECMGVSIGAAGDEVATYIPIPWDLDLDRPIEYRVWFTHQATDADTPIWKIHMLPRESASEALLPVLDNIASGGTVTCAAVTVSTTADVVEKTAWSPSTASWFATDDDFLGISVEADDLGSASADEMILIGLEMRYTIKATTTDNARRIT